MKTPIVKTHAGIHVIRDDLFLGGTKARAVNIFFRGVPGVVYATPAEGGAQTALAYVARRLNKRFALFVAGRKEPHPRMVLAQKIGAEVHEIRPGYLSVVQKRASDYAASQGLSLMPFGGQHPEVVEGIAAAAQSIPLSSSQQPDEIWCTGGSGVLATALGKAWPNAELHVVQVGKKVKLPQATVYVYDRPFSKHARTFPPFPSDPHYDAKAWEILIANRNTRQRADRNIFFWNVTGPADSYDA